MICAFYFDLKLKPPTDDAPDWDRMGRVIRALHVAKSRTGMKFAIDFPQWMEQGFSLGETLRVFGQTSGDLDVIYDSIEDCTWFEANFESGRIRPVKNVIGYYALVHQGFGGNKAKPRMGFTVEQCIEKALRRKAAFFVKAGSLPYVKIRSSSGNLFNLRFFRVQAKQNDNGEPNGYGVSRPTQIIALPILP